MILKYVASPRRITGWKAILLRRTKHSRRADHHLKKVAFIIKTTLSYLLFCWNCWIKQWCKLSTASCSSWLVSKSTTGNPASRHSLLDICLAWEKLCRWFKNESSTLFKVCCTSALASTSFKIALQLGIAYTFAVIVEVEYSEWSKSEKRLKLSPSFSHTFRRGSKCKSRTISEYCCSSVFRFIS